MKNLLVGLSSSILDTAENKSNKLGDRILEIIQTKVQREKKSLKRSLVTCRTIRDTLTCLQLELYKKRHERDWDTKIARRKNGHIFFKV